ncbi:hypothetical protein [Rhizomicrobium electricum]|uniref:Uncharacterized protein n=1 Tax=Rhizomicrobium electricum TaxID=480070 RepID=A0ABP3NXV6_9PROT|nr:hypothetical protein [Rhizomicrobium electricum]NIJ47288.1 hypothetical protein [Rhizomicrobium electricum]
MFAARSGAAGFLARHHSAALSAVAAFAGLATAAATASVWYQSIVWLDVAALALGAVLAAAIGYWHLRHLTLAILVAVTPLPGLLWAAPLSAGSSFGLVPVIAYAFGFALATLYVQRLLDRLLRSRAGEAPWYATGVMLVLTAVLVPIWFHGTNSNAAVQAASDLIGTSASVLLLLPLSLPLLRFDEAFVAEANRARERRGRIFEWLGGAAIPRWGLSFTGIALVFLALGWFGAEAMLLRGWWQFALTAVLVCAALGAFAGGWREGLGLGLVLALVTVVALWWRSYDPRLPFGAVAILEMTMLAGLLALAGARQMRRWRASGEPSDMVRRRALEDSAGGVFATLGATAAAMPSLIHAGAPVVVLSILAAGLCGALLFPAILTALETLLPHRRSVEDVFHAGR